MPRNGFVISSLTTTFSILKGKVPSVAGIYAISSASYLIFGLWLFTLERNVGLFPNKYVEAVLGCTQSIVSYGKYVWMHHLFDRSTLSDICTCHKVMFGPMVNPLFGNLRIVYMLIFSSFGRLASFFVNSFTSKYCLSSHFAVSRSPKSSGLRWMDFSSYCTCVFWLVVQSPSFRLERRCWRNVIIVSSGGTRSGTCPCRLDIFWSWK